jgi:hypothetical protein
VATLAVVAVAAPAATERPGLLEQARALARQQAAATAPAADIFADRPARLPRADAGRFRMRKPLSVARVVEAVSAEFVSVEWQQVVVFGLLLVLLIIRAGQAWRPGLFRLPALRSA